MTARAKAITHPLEALTPEEKIRLGYLVMWAIDGPEQGFIDNYGAAEVRLELHQFLTANGVHAGGQWVHHAKHVLSEKNPDILKEP